MCIFIMYTDIFIISNNQAHLKKNILYLLVFSAQMFYRNAQKERNKPKRGT